MAPRGLTPPPATPPSAGSRAAGPATAEEMQVLAYVNTIRRQQSLRPLNFQPDLWVAARDHSREQQRHGYMGHGSPDPNRQRLSQRMARAGYQGSVFAEVVAWGYPDTRSVVDGWMNSPDHRRILVDPELTEAGFSRVGPYWTGNFGAPRRFARAAPRRGGAARTPTARAPTARAPATVQPRSPPARAPVPRAQPRPPIRTAPAPRPQPQYRTPSNLPFRLPGG